MIIAVAAEMKRGIFMKNFQRLVITFILVSFAVCCFSFTTYAMPVAFAGYSSLYSIFAHDFAVLASEELAPILNEIFNALSSPLQEWLIAYDQSDSIRVEQKFLDAYVGIMARMLLNNPVLKHRANVQANQLTKDDLVSAGTTIQVQELPLTSEQLATIATETTRTKNLIRSLLEEIQVLKYDLTEYILHIPTSLTALRNQVIDGFDSLSLTLQTFRQNFVDKIIDLQTVVGEFRAAVNERFSDLQYTLGVKLGDVNIHLHAIRENLTARLASIDGLFDIKLSDIKTVVSTFRTQFVEKIGSLQTTLSTFRTQFVEKIGELKHTVVCGLEVVQTQIKELEETFTKGLVVSVATPNFNSDNEDNKKVGIGGGLGWFGTSSDLLGEYGVGLLAAGLILKQFTDLKYFDSLITIGLAIGLVSVFFGIALDVTSRESAKKTAGQIRSVNKAGFNAGFKAGVERNGG